MAKFRLLRRLLLDEQVLQANQIRRPPQYPPTGSGAHPTGAATTRPSAVINSAARNSAASGFLPPGPWCSAPGYPSGEPC